MSILETDKSLEILVKPVKLKVNLENILITNETELELNLINWEKQGIRLGIKYRFFEGYYNEISYLSKYIALNEYSQILEQIRKGDYAILIIPKGEIKLYVGKDLEKLDLPVLTEKIS